MARLEAGDLQVQFAPTDLREVVSDVVENAERELANGHRFVVEIPEEPLDASADRDKVRQILANLVDNALKYSPSGGTVTVAARKTHDAVQVRVVDEGIGVPQGEQERIFRKFYRAEAAPADRRHGPRALHRAGARERDGRPRLGRLRRRAWARSFVFELPADA